MGNTYEDEKLQKLERITTALELIASCVYDGDSYRYFNIEKQNV
jgi:hypothetical protein